MFTVAEQFVKIKDNFLERNHVSVDPLRYTSGFYHLLVSALDGTLNFLLIERSAPGACAGCLSCMHHNSNNRAVTPLRKN